MQVTSPDGDGGSRRLERRRPRRQRVFDDSVPSPCINVCQVDDAEDLCIGCYRHIDEIRDWPILSADEKRAVLARCAARKTAAQPAGEEFDPRTTE